MRSKTDAELVRRACAGDQGACAALVERYQRPLLALILRMVRDRPLAEDLLQESLIKAFRALERYDPSRRFASWLFKIAHNTVLDHLRRRGIAWVSLDDERSERAPEGVADSAARSPEALALASDLGAVLEAALHELRPSYREVLLLRFAEGLTYEEIAEVTGQPLGTIKTHLHRARQRLRTALERRGYGSALGWDQGSSAGGG